MQRSLVVLLFSVVLLFIGCGGDGGSPPTQTGSTVSATTAALSLAGQMNQGIVQDSTTSFSLHTLQDLHVYTTYENLDEGSHQQLIKFFSPDGALYYQKIVPFSTTPSKVSAGPLKTMTGIPHAREVQQAMNTVDGYVTVTTLPVGGTWITQHGMSGTWRVEVFLDNGVSPIASGTFTLTD